MKKEVHEFISKHQLFHHNATIIVAVSGGPDSMALLHYLNSIKQDWGFRLIALSVDHGLRGEQSREDVQYVESICNQWEIEFIATFLDVPSYKKSERKGTQLAARELRYRFFEQQMEELEADYLALAHHGDDQVETMMMRLVRNSNPSLLKGMPTKRRLGKGFLVRPFLCLTKQMIETYCYEHGVIPRRDPSNNEDTYTRNFFRHHVLPLLQEQNPKLHTSVQRLSESITQDELFLAEETRKFVDQVVQFDKTMSKISFTSDQFISYPFALQRRGFHLILNYLYNVIPTGLYYGHEDQFFDLIHSDRANVTIDLPLDLKLNKTYKLITFYFSDPSPTDFQKMLAVPGDVCLPDGSIITAKVTTDLLPDSKYVLNFPITNPSIPYLMIRTRRSGDKMRIKGLNGSKKVKDIFINEKIPLYQRNSWPLVVDQQGDIIWLVGLKKGTPKDEASTKYFLQLEYKPGNTKEG